MTELSQRPHTLRWPVGHYLRKRTTLSPTIVSGLVALSDMAIIGAGFMLYLAYPGWDASDYPAYLSAVIAHALITAIMFYLAGLYNFHAVIRPAPHLHRVVAISGLVFLVLVTLTFALKASETFSRIWTFAWQLSVIIGLCGGRLLIQRLLYRSARAGRIARNLIVVGAGAQGRRLLEQLNTMREPWYRVIGVFDDRTQRTPPCVKGHNVLGNLDDLVNYTREHPCDDILLALPWAADARIKSILDKLKILPVYIGLSSDLTGNGLPVTGFSRYLGGLPVLDVSRKPLDGWGSLLKRALDILLSTLLLVLLLPLMVIIAVLIKLDTPGPVFFVQNRYGFNNKLIPMLKYRTMYVHAQDNDAATLTSPNDARVTRLGAWLRRASIDELPQLINVIKGEMSLVGPRPHALKASAGGRLYGDVVADYAARHRVKPGITGWAQVNGWRGETDTPEKITRRVEYDLYYIENWSLQLDLKILIQTLWVCLLGKNAY